MRPEDNSAEYTQSAGLTSFTSTGYVLGSDNGYNASGQTYVGWNWKAGTDQGSTATTGAGIAKTYTASYSVDAGFSIIKYTGNGSAGHTIPHHLSSKPLLIMCKQLTSANNWQVGAEFSPMDETDNLWLDTSSQYSDDVASWSDTSANATNFTLGANGAGNHNNLDYIAYCWHSVEGYSKIRSYIGNGNTDGTFVYCGFRPAYVLRKRINGSNSWCINDTARNPYNLANYVVLADTSAADTSGSNQIDFVSNGFKMKATDAHGNASGGIYLYMAFAETPFKNANAR